MIVSSGSRTLIGVLIGAFGGFALGIGMFTFVYANGASYMTDNPAACANCHIMGDHFDRWIKSSHRAVAVCNDCHTPDGFIAKYTVKASNGFWHSYAFTTGDYPDPLRIKPHNLEVTNEACRKCHADIVDAIEGPHQSGPILSCLPCHRSVGHPSQ